MQRLIVHNVGPIKVADIGLKKVNVFIGPQSSGKSTIAKIISFCTWLEKNKHEMGETYLFSNKVIDKMVGYHRMEGYLSEESRIFYQGDNIAFAYNWPDTEAVPLDFPDGGNDVYPTNYSEKEKFFFKKERTANPKVMYIPAERNFVSVVPNLKKYDDSKDSLQGFVMDWFEAKRSYDKAHALDIISLDMKYFSENDEDYIQMADGKSIRLRNASSGLQSVTPLVAVANYMTQGIYEKERPFSVEEQDVLNKVLRSLADDSLSKNDASEMKRRLLGFMQGKVYSHTQFIIEEPEQNLFPREQYKLMEHLIAIINHGKQHRMTVTTHSPYIVNFLNVLLRRKENAASYISHDDLNVYLISDGKLTDMMLHNSDRTKWAVDTSVLSAAMDDIAEEFESKFHQSSLSHHAVLNGLP